MSEGSLSPIIVKYERLLEEDPRSRSFAPLAEAYRQVGLLEKAFDVLKKGLRYNPEYLLGYLTLALCYFDKKEYGLAYSTLKPLIAQNRDNLKLQKVFADCAKKTNNLEEALDSYKYLLFLNPRDKEIANQVSLLEEELHEEAVYAREENPTFDVGQLHPNPEDDKEIDNWVQYDLSLSHGSNEEKEDIDEWSVGKPNESDDNSEVGLVFDREGDNDEDALFIYDQEQALLDQESENEDENEDEYEEKYDGDKEYDSNVISLERKSIKEVEEDITPVITHTLVDIYIKQGHYLKAKDILEKIIEVGPITDAATKKLAELNEFIGAERHDKEATDNEGRENLMAAFDKSVGGSIFDDEESEPQPEHETDSSKLVANIDLVLSDYLSELKQKQQKLDS